MSNRLPLLPLILDDVPPGLVRALVQEGIPFAHRQPGPPQGRFLLFDSRAARHVTVSAGQQAIDIDQLRHPHFTVDPFQAMLDNKAAQYTWRVSGFDISEEISRYDKREIRRGLMSRLRDLLERHGGVWLRVAAYPFPYRSAFNFRIDYDHYVSSDFHATLDAIHGHEGATSHFVNAAEYLEADDFAWQRLRGLDLGSHGYWHHTYRDAEENSNNIRRGIDFLRSRGIDASGFTAPMGRYYPHLPAVLRRFNVSHSSEFGLAHDDLPFTMGENGALQIPIHPVCLRLFLEAAQRTLTSTHASRFRSAVAAASEHLCSTAEQKYHSGEPVFLYGHPTGSLGRHPQLLQDVFRAVDQFSAVWKTTMTQFASWWRARQAVRLTVLQHREKLTVAADNMPRNYRLGIAYHRDDREALIPLDSPSVSFLPATLDYQRKATCHALCPVHVDHPHGIKDRIRRLIDWELVTPPEEIAATNWQNYVKRKLRRWHKAA